MADLPITRTINAYNTATESENKIHDDATASRFGFTGGLVPGVDVFAYMTHAPVALWGPDWLKHGAMQARFLSPVYDGEDATLEAEEAGEDGLLLSLTSRAESCATGRAYKTAAAPTIEIPRSGQRPDQDARPPASPASLPLDAVLGYNPEPYTAELGREHLADTRQDPALFADGRIANPAWLLRRANYILAENVMLGPWIHSESDIRLHRHVTDGDTIDVRARVSDNFERKGHLIVALNFAVLVGDEPAMTGRHVAIYQPRQVRED